MDIKMTLAEWNKAVNAWLEEQIKHAGEERPVDWPQEIYGLRSGLENKVVTPDQITRYAANMGDLNPLWADADYAHTTRWGGIIAPPTFENCVGAPYDYWEIFKLPGFLTIMDASAVREYFTVIRPLDEFTAVDIYTGVKEESETGKPYRHFIQKIQRTYRNQRHEKVAVVNRSMAIIVDAPGSRYAYRKERFGNIERPHYSREELDKIYHDYDEQLEGKWRRGAETRYWEDVQEGEEIHPLIAGPLDGSESLFIQKIGYTRSYALKWAAIKQDLTRAPVDPETGEYRYFVDEYYKDIIAREVGLPYTAGFPLQNEAICTHALTDWMGDDGFIEKVEVQHAGMNFQGDTTHVKGKVSQKYIDQHKHLVKLDFWSECQDRRPLVRGTATILLPARGKYDFQYNEDENTHTIEGV